jgi:hypothetical protein
MSSWPCKRWFSSRGTTASPDEEGIVVRPEDIREMLADDPFVPLRLYLSDGSQYEVLHRDAVLLTHSKLIIGLPSDHASWERPFDRFAHVALLHINRIEPMAARN